jgi:hypothetical protein
LQIFFAFIILLTLILLNIHIRRSLVGAPDWLIAFLQTFGLFACLPHFGLRMQELGFLFLFLELWILAEFNYKKKWLSLIWLPPLLYFWSSAHGSFLLGIGLLFIWVIVKVVERGLYFSRFQKYFIADKISSWREIKFIAVIAQKRIKLETIGRQESGHQ